MLADSMIAARLINGNLGAFRFNGRIAPTLYQSPRARKSRGKVDKIISRGAAAPGYRRSRRRLDRGRNGRNVRIEFRWAAGNADRYRGYRQTRATRSGLCRQGRSRSCAAISEGRPFQHPHVRRFRGPASRGRQVRAANSALAHPPGPRGPAGKANLRHGRRSDREGRRDRYGRRECDRSRPAGDVVHW